MADRDKILEVHGLETEFRTKLGIARAVDGVTFSVKRGQTLGLVGESGSGKSATALSIMGLIDQPGRIRGGEVIFEGRNLLILDKREMRSVRGAQIGMIFQEPMTSLNPVFTVGDQISETVKHHQKLDGRGARKKAVQMLEMVGIASAATRVDDYPHQMSGGMRQRVMIAMALCCNPKLLIADEPTTALDVTTQAQILDLIISLQDRLGMSILLITHDLGVVAEMCDDVAVMYAGQVVEHASRAQILGSPQHPYTEGLLRSMPHLGMTKTEKLGVIQGTIPSAYFWPSGCRFAPRCEYRFSKCDSAVPLFTTRLGFSRCWLAEGGEPRRAASA